MNCNNQLLALQDEIVACTRCPRLTSYCREIASLKRKAFRDQEYWGRPVPSFGDPNARLLILGLAPAAHGANRTGRVFTGDRSGEFLYRALYQTGFASQPGSERCGDGLNLRDAWVTCSVHCAPPDNKPAPQELRNCRSWLVRELELMPRVQVVVALGKIAFDFYLSVFKESRKLIKRSDFTFGHNRVHALDPVLISSYHPSQQNTSTGRLTEEMLLDVFVAARAACL